MTDVADRTLPDEPAVSPLDGAATDAVTPAAEPPVTSDEAGPSVELALVVRPIAVALLASAAAGFMTGGVFGSWAARLIAAGAALLGVAWSVLCLRSRRQTVMQVLLIPVASLVGMLSLLPTREGPARMFSLIGDAISSGRLLRPPVPFDPGWRPALIVLLALVGYAAGWVAVAMQRPQLGLALPVPVIGLTAISQPAEGELVAGLLGFLPLLLALALLFGGDSRRVSELSLAFEIRRAVRGIPLLLGGVALLVVFSQTDFLFPKPAYNPVEKPQKPKAIPLGEVRDRVLFEIDGGITGPWKTGVLDVYDGESWRLPPFDEDRMERVTGDGTVDSARAGDVTVTFTIRDLGTSSVLPGVAGMTRFTVRSGAPGGDLLYDERVGVVRLGTGRVPQDMTYEMTLPAYPTPEQLASAGPLTTDVDDDLLYIPDPPPGVQSLLDQAPATPWARLDFLRSKLNEVVIAVGAGAPDKAVPPSKVDDLLVGSHEGSPFEIVAAEAMLARWAGIPSRIAYGFDGFLDEDGKKVVRPKLGSNWLEAYFEGFGWVPLIGTPPKAKASLDTDPNARFDPNITPSDDVAVELYIPIELDDLTQLYEQIRSLLLRVLPYLLAALASYLAFPSLRRAQRRRKRRAWARANGFREQIAVEYCEFRDAATDLNIGDPYDTPLEFLQQVVDDDEHAELAWLVVRTTYGDLFDKATEDDAEAAREMATSLRKRMFRAQPMQSRVLAMLSRASLREPLTDEVPNVKMIQVRRAKTGRGPGRGPRRSGGPRRPRRVTRRIRVPGALRRVAMPARKP
jgi:hypothetical protein